MGFQLIAYRGLETGVRDRVSYVLNQNNINLVITSPLQKNTPIGSHIDIHGDGIKLFDNNPNYSYEIITDVSPENLIKKLF